MAPPRRNAANDAAAVRVLDELKNDPERLGEIVDRSASGPRSSTRPKAAAHLDAKADARREFVKLLRSLLDQGDAHEDDGSTEFFKADPETLVHRSREGGRRAPAALVGRRRRASGTPAVPPSLGDFLEGVQAAARRLANYATYYQMKARAGTVGALVSQCRAAVPHEAGWPAAPPRRPQLRRTLVTAAAHALAASTPTSR